MQRWMQGAGVSFRAGRGGTHCHVSPRSIPSIVTSSPFPIKTINITASQDMP